MRVAVGSVAESTVSGGCCALDMSSTVLSSECLLCMLSLHDCVGFAVLTGANGRGFANGVTPNPPPLSTTATSKRKLEQHCLHAPRLDHYYYRDMYDRILMSLRARCLSDR